MSNFFTIFIIVVLSWQNVFAASPSVAKPLSVEPIATEKTNLSLDNSFGQKKLEAIFSGPLNKFESFRKKQAIYFEKLRDDTKQKLGMQIKDDIMNKISPIFSPPTEVPAIGTDQTSDDLTLTKTDDPFQAYKYSDSKYYVTLIFSTAMVSFFASIILFYIASVIVLLFLLRLVFKMLF